jgi:Cof subfamily protein (haloacid dehalogenase superfamily)
MTYRLIALDVDGTLMNDKHELSPRVRRAVRAASEQGAEIVLCTGRGPTSTFPVLEALGLKGTLITHNGASVLDSETRKVIAETAMSPGPARKYTSLFRERGIHFDMNTTFELYVEKIDDHLASIYKRMSIEPIVRGENEAFPEGLVKISAYAPKNRLDELESYWADWKHELQTVRSGDFFIDIQHPLATKGKALEQLAAIRGVPREQILAIGNYFNDIGMLVYAGMGVAMGNSPEGVKEVADEVTATNNEDGVALVLESRVLGR